MFHYKTLGDVRSEAEKQQIILPLSENTSLLKNPFEIKGKTVPNRIAIQPMEGCDGTAEGCPGELTLRRYDKFAESGAGLIWEEATAVWKPPPSGRKAAPIRDSSGSTKRAWTP